MNRLRGSTGTTCRRTSRPDRKRPSYRAVSPSRKAICATTTITNQRFMTSPPRHRIDDLAALALEEGAASQEDQARNDECEAARQHRAEQVEIARHQLD